MKKREKIGFWGLLSLWLCFAILFGGINVLLLKISLLYNVTLASLGIILLIYPVYPIELTAKFTEKKCRLFIRILACIEILLSFATRMTF